MSIQQYGATAIDLAKEQIKNWFKSKLKIVAIVIVVAIGVLLPFFTIIGNAEGEESSSSAQGMQSASSTSWKQFLRFSEINEGGPKTDDGLYYLVHDDGYGYPTIGHGLCLKSSDGYLNVGAFNTYGIDSKDLADRWLTGERNLTVSVEICDAIWEEGVKSRYESIVAQYPELTTYQHYALTDVKYRRGNTDGFQEEYNSKWSSSDDKYGEYIESEENFSTDTLFNFFWNGGHSLPGVRTRKQDQWLLFKYGYYRPLNEYFIGGTGYYSSDFYGGIEIYNSDGSVNREKMAELSEYLTNSINTVKHKQNYQKQQGPFPKWWNTPINSLEKFQCTWWANGRASQYLELIGSKYPEYPTESGHGYQYYNVNKENGWFNYGSQPKAGSIISWTDGGSYGHVAFVEAVDYSTGNIWVSHAGGGWSWYGVQELSPSTGYSYNLSNSYIKCNGFIYLDEPLK